MFPPGGIGDLNKKHIVFYEDFIACHAKIIHIFIQIYYDGGTLIEILNIEHIGYRKKCNQRD